MNINSTIISGSQAINDIRYLLTSRQHVLFVTDRNIVQQPGNPCQHNVAHILEALPNARTELVIGVGGGSVLDVAKLLSLLCVGDKAVSLDTLLAGEKPPHRNASLLIPTTASTGSEATPNAILAIPEKATKVGIITPVMLPDYVALVPELTTSMPSHIAASTGIDTLYHLLECFTATIANPVGDNYALIVLKKLFANIELSIHEPENLEARLNMLWASYYGGVAIAHAGTHLVHAMSYPFCGKYHIPHGVANAILLAPCMRFVRPAAEEKFAQVYDLLPDANLSLSVTEKSHALVTYFTDLVQRLALPSSLQQLGIEKTHLPELIEGALQVQRLMKNVPATVKADDVRDIYLTLF